MGAAALVRTRDTAATARCAAGRRRCSSRQRRRDQAASPAARRRVRRRRARRADSARSHVGDHDAGRDLSHRGSRSGRGRVHLPGRVERASSRQSGNGRAGPRDPHVASQSRLRGGRNHRLRPGRRRGDGAPLPAARRLPGHAGRTEQGQRGPFLVLLSRDERSSHAAAPPAAGRLEG